MVAQAKTVMGEKAYTQTELWYLLLTNENYQKHYKVFIDFALRFLNRTLNETIVGSEVSSLEDIETKKRRLKHHTSAKLNFVSTNRPHPLVSVPFDRDMLTDFSLKTGILPLVYPNGSRRRWSMVTLRLLEICLTPQSDLSVSFMYEQFVLSSPEQSSPLLINFQDFFASGSFYSNPPLIDILLSVI